MPGGEHSGRLPAVTAAHGAPSSNRSLLPLPSDEVQPGVACPKSEGSEGRSVPSNRVSPRIREPTPPLHYFFFQKNSKSINLSYKICFAIWFWNLGRNRKEKHPVMIINGVYSSLQQCQADRTPTKGRRPCREGGGQSRAPLCCPFSCPQNKTQQQLQGTTGPLGLSTPAGRRVASLGFFARTWQPPKPEISSVGLILIY